MLCIVLTLSIGSKWGDAWGQDLRAIELEKKRRNQIIDIEEYLTNISKYIGEVTFNKGNVDLGEPIQLTLIHLGREKEAFDNFAHQVRTLIRQHPDYIDYNYRGLNLYESLREINKEDLKKSENISVSDFEYFKSKINKVQDLYERIEFTIEKEEFKKNLEIQRSEVEETVKNVKSAKEALEGKLTEEIYSQAAKKYIITARVYDVLLLCTLGIFYYITSKFYENFKMISIFQSIEKSSSEAQTLAIFFFITKLTVVSIVITLATIFIRRSSHFRKLYDQANQTSLELNAIPNYLRQVDSEHHSEIYKEMIPKFFGKELDQSQNDKVGDLEKDQLAAGTELIKASAEMVKNAKSLGDSADKTRTIKPKNTSTEDKTQSEGDL